MNEPGPMLKFQSPDEDLHLIFEDDGKTGYAYIHHQGEVSGAVWLYNNIAAPSIDEWKDSANIPFANCMGYMLEGGYMQTPVTDQDVLVDWDGTFREASWTAFVYIREDLFGVVGPGDNPGYARHAKTDSPLARVMQTEE